jgi:small subunit ribosomal protein S18
MRMIRKRIIRRAKPGKCYFCQEKKEPDYKNPEILSRFMSERGKILSTQRTGLCAKHQRRLARQIKRSRFLALLPFVTRV